jgi:hypothetical protein
MVKITNKGLDEPLPDPGLFPEASAIAFSEPMRNIVDKPPPKSPPITPAAIGVLSGSTHIFQPQATFTPTFSQTSLPARIRATTTQTKQCPTSAAARFAVPVCSGPSSSGGGPQPATAGGGTNGGMRGNAPTIFTGDRSKSDEFLREFKIYHMVNSQNNAMLVPLDRIGLAISFIRGLNVNDWVENMLN